MPVEPVRLEEEQLERVAVEAARQPLDVLPRVPRQAVVLARVVGVRHEGDPVLRHVALESRTEGDVDLAVLLDSLERALPLRCDQEYAVVAERLAERLQQLAVAAGRKVGEYR